MQGDIHTYRQTDNTDTHTMKHTYIHAYRHTDKQTYIHTDNIRQHKTRQTDKKHTYIHTYIHTNIQGGQYRGK